MNEERLALIIAAIQGLKPEDFTKAGAPKVAAMKAVVPDITPEELEAALAKIQADKPAEITVTFDTTGATSVVTMRDGSAKKVWFRDGKEIGVENAG